ncbi:MAG: hypothetical protein V1780_01745 [Chloroflexota bacterium]
MLKLAGELLEGQLADHEVELDAHIRSPWQELRTGEYHLFVPFITENASVAVTADTFYAVPITIPRRLTVDRIAIRVAGAAGAGKKARLGIYGDGTNLYPGSLVLDAGEVAVDSTGVKAITIDQLLDKGRYWLALVSDGTPTVYASVDTLVSPLGLVETGFNALYVYWSVSFTYAALPDPFTGGGVKNSSGNQRGWAIPLRLKSLD